MENKGGQGYTYGDGDHVHAATAMGDNSYTYDASGNMVVRNLVSGTVTGIYTLTHNADNRLVQVTGPFTTTYIYDGDQNLVVALIQTTDTVTTTIYTGNYYEYEKMDTISGTEVVTTSYYYAGSTRVAMRKNVILSYILSDHLGSSTLTTDASGVKTSEQKYMPYGKTRGTGKVEADYTYTGQRSFSHINLTHMGARWYDPELGAFIQADTIIPSPGNTKDWNRFTYVRNNPVRYTDSSGHCIDGLSTWICVAVVLLAMGLVVSGDTVQPEPEPKNYPQNNHGGTGCTANVPSCFGDVVFLKDFSDNGPENPIPAEEFEEFADEVAMDLYSHDLGWPGLQAGRGA